MSVKRCQREVDSAEFAEWMYVDANIDPIGSWPVYFAGATTAATVFNANRGLKTKPAKAADFMPKFKAAGQRDPATLADRLHRKMLLLSKVLGRDDNR